MQIIAGETPHSHDNHMLHKYKKSNLLLIFS